MHLATSNSSGEIIIQGSNSERVLFSRLKSIVATIGWPKTILYTFLSPVIVCFASTSVTAEDHSYEALQENGNSFLPPISPVHQQPRTTSSGPDLSRTLSKQSQQITLPGEKSSTQVTQTGSVWRTVGALMAVLALFLLGSKLWRKQIPMANFGLPTEAIEILGRKPIEARLSVYLIRCGERILVVGSSTDGMQTLAEVTDPVEVDHLAGICRRTDREHGFAQSLLTLFNRRSSTHIVPEQSPQEIEMDADENAITFGQLNIEPATGYDQKSETVHA